MTQSPTPTPLSGAYYWIPAQLDLPITWRLISCHELGVWEGISHREFWPYVLKHLAGVWGRDAGVLNRRLGDGYAGLPRGRITRPEGQYMIIHGNDPPVKNWKAAIKTRFQLQGLRIEVISDEHERMLREDARAFEQAFGIELRLPRV